MPNLSDNIERKFVETYDASEWEIETDTGWESLVNVSKTVKYDLWEIKLENGMSLKGADNHIVFDKDMNEVFLKDCSAGTLIQTAEGLSSVQERIDHETQEHMYDVHVDSDNHRFYSSGILSHNSTTTVAFFLWYIIFHKYKVLGILANKGATAKEILGRLQLAYEELPKWLQQGVVAWNKGNIELENGCEVIAASTSSSAVRGYSFSCVAVDSTSVTMRNKETGEIESNNIRYFIEKEKSINTKKKLKVEDFI